MVNMVVKSEQRNLVQCTVVGDGMVGKSSLSLAFTNEPSLGDYVATVFENYAGKTNVAGDEYTVGIFDSAGQHDYESLREFTYKDSEVFVVCYSVVDRESFESIKEFWVPEMKNNMHRKKPIILVATQTDLRNTTGFDSDMPVTEEEGRHLAKAIGAETYNECTVQNQISVKKVFTDVVTCALKYRKKKANIMHRLFGK